METPRSHPAADLFPLMDESSPAFNELVDDIKTNGLLYPILLHNGEILDGRNRLRACQIADVEPRFETWDGPDPYHRVISLNLHRRHLTKDQAAAIAMDAKPKLMEEIERNRRTHQALTQSGRAKMMNSSSQAKASRTTRHQLAKTFDTSEWKIEQAEQVKATNPATLKEVKNGTITLREAVKVAPPSRGPRYVLNPDTALPGQWEERKLPKTNPTLGARVLEGVSKGRGLKSLADEVRDGDLDLDDRTIRALVDRLEIGARERRLLSKALQAVLERRPSA